VSTGDLHLTVLHTPGHSPDHLAFWHEPTRAVFTGDLVIPGGSVMIHTSRGGDLAAYMASLERLLTLEPRVLWPAHGPRIDDPVAVITTHLEHRRLRERQVLDMLHAGRTTVQAIGETIYHGLDPALMPAAHENVRAHLDKLRRDGIVREVDGNWTPFTRSP
jgi:glyoxylase-like metal-dependent hydrolase (beta-lactamase superfamily II)